MKAILTILVAVQSLVVPALIWTHPSPAHTALHYHRNKELHPTFHSVRPARNSYQPLEKKDNRAVRPTMPPALVGPGCGGCDLTPILDAIQQCCAETTLTVSLLTTVSTCCSEVFSTLTECCNDIQTTLTSGLIDTLTTDIINSVTSIIATLTVEIIDTITASQCCPCTPITQALVDASGGTFIIAAPGNYALSSDISVTGTVGIVIAASNVALDLCFHKLIGGALTLDGILIEPSLSNITIINGAIDPIRQDGIHISDGVTHFTLSNLSISGAARAGIHLDGQSFEIVEGLIENCTVDTSATDTTGTALAGLAANSCKNIAITGGNYSNNGSSSTPVTGGILLTQCHNCTVQNVLANSNTGITAFGIQIFNGLQNIIESSLACENVATITAYGIVLNSSSGDSASQGYNTVKQSIASSNFSQQACYGIALLGVPDSEAPGGEVYSNIINCIAEHNIGGPIDIARGLLGVGIFINAQNEAKFNNLIGNTVSNNQNMGIYEDVLASSGSTTAVNGSTSLLSGNFATNNGLIDSLVIPGSFSNNYVVQYANSDGPITIQVNYTTGTITGGTTNLALISNVDAIGS